jgi:hypothetical protein
MTVRLYIIPVVHLTNPVYNVPAYLPHRFNPALAGLEGVPWAWTTYLLEDWGMIIADTTAVQNTLLDAQAGTFPVANLDATIPNTSTRNRIRNTLEAGYIPGTWINTNMVYRNVLRALAGMIDFHNRFVGITSDRFFKGGITLSTTVGQLTAAQKAAFILAAQELGVNYASVTDATTLRTVLLLANNLYNAGRPYEIRGAGMSMVI